MAIIAQGYAVVKGVAAIGHFVPIDNVVGSQISSVTTLPANVAVSAHYLVTKLLPN
jgi:hypothetical protein